MCFWLCYLMKGMVKQRERESSTMSINHRMTQSQNCPGKNIFKWNCVHISHLSPLHLPLVEKDQIREYLGKQDMYNSMGPDEIHPQVLMSFQGHVGTIMVIRRGTQRMEESKCHFHLQGSQERGTRELQAS